MLSSWLAWAQANSAVVHVGGSLLIAIGTVTAALITAQRYLAIYQTHVSIDFFKRYAEISQRMPDRLRLSKIKDQKIALPEVVTPDEWALIARSMIEYGNLCSEEFALHQRKLVPAEIWSIWRAGMKENFETQIWRDGWALVEIEYRSYKKFSSFMKDLIEEARADEAKSAGA